MLRRPRDSPRVVCEASPPAFGHWDARPADKGSLLRSLPADRRPVVGCRIPTRWLARLAGRAAASATAVAAAVEGRGRRRRPYWISDFGFETMDEYNWFAMPRRGLC